MTANCRRIHRMAGVVGHRLGERRGDDLPDPSLAPSSEALIDGHPLAVLVQEIALRRPGSDVPQDAVDDHAVVERRPALAAALRRQQALQQPPFRFAQISSAQDCLPRIHSLDESNPKPAVNNFVNRT